MKKIILFYTIVFFSVTVYSQNLVPNSSFERLWTCPESYVPASVKKPYPDWINPNGGTPDAFHACSQSKAGVPDNFAGYLYPFDGSSYAGIILWEKDVKGKRDLTYISREYIQAELQTPLKRNKLYCVQLRYANASKTMYSTDALGIALTRQKINAQKRGLIIQIPQVINKPGHIMENHDYWEELCGTYRARGSESYITIGNFWDNAQTIYKINEREGLDSSLVYAYYYIDDVRVFEIENAFECGCQNNLSYGSDRFAEDYDPSTGYNSLVLNHNEELAENENSTEKNKDSGNSKDATGNNSNSENTKDINGHTGNDFIGDGSKSTISSGSAGSIYFKESEITEGAFNDAQIGDKFNLNRIFFEFNSSELLAISYSELDKLYDILVSKPNLRIEIRGHTDNVGSTQYNKTLSVKRAESVYNYLLDKGIKENRMKYRGFGNRVPISDNETEEGRSMNRRVEIIIMEL